MESSSLISLEYGKFSPLVFQEMSDFQFSGEGSQELHLLPELLSSLASTQGAAKTSALGATAGSEDQC